MGWTKREVASNLVILGDEEGNVQKAGGLLAAITPDSAYDGNYHYELVQKDGKSINVAGSASINRTVRDKDIGKFIKFEFHGWGKSARGKFKQIEVNIWEDEPTEDMKKWPRYAELQQNGKQKVQAAAEQARDEFDGFGDGPPPEDDSDLPF